MNADPVDLQSLRLLRAFVRIQELDVREAIVNLTEAAAEGGNIDGLVAAKPTVPPNEMS